MNKPYLWRVMRILVLFMLAGFIHVSASTKAQTVTLKASSLAFQELINVIRQQTDFEIYVNKEFLKGTKPVSVEAVDMPIDQFLEFILEGQPLEAKIDAKTIILFRPHAEQSESVGRLQRRLIVNNQFRLSSVQGRVLDSLTRPLVGATVRLLGATRQVTLQITQTDQTGRFLFHNVPENATVELSFVGYVTKRIAVTPNLGDVYLQSLNAAIEAVTVTTGYQQISKERATGSYAKVTHQSLSKKPTMNVLERLEGITSGVAFHRNSVDENPKVIVRGRSTIYGNDQPLVVVDGFPIEGDLSQVNPNDVEDITILRDAAAASIWGVRAANGVIVVSTRRGKPNERPKIELSSQMLIGQRPDLFYLPYMSTSDYVDLERSWWDAGRFTNLATMPLERQPVLSPVIQALHDAKRGLITQEEAENRIAGFREIDVRNEYSELFYRPKMHQQHALTVRGGGERIQYAFSAGYDKDLATEVGNETDRITLRADHTYAIFNDLKLHVALNQTWSSRERNAIGLTAFQGETGSFLGSASVDQFTFYPYQRLRDADGKGTTIPRRYPLEYDQLLQDQYGLLPWGYNPLDEIKHRDNHVGDQYSRVATALTYRIFEEFSADLRYQFERNVIQTRNYYSPDLYFTRNLINSFSQLRTGGNGLIYNVPMGAVLVRENGDKIAHTFRGQLNYNKRFGADIHDVAAIAGMEMREFQDETRLNAYYGYDERTMLFTDFNKTQLYPMFGQSYYGSIGYEGGISDRFAHVWNRYASFYANASYTYDGRYVISSSARMDKSSLFGVNPKNRNVPLWSTGLAWNISREAFLQGSELSELRFRATYGFNGNVNPSQTAFPLAYASRDPMTNLPNARISSPANPLLQWETVRQVNFALDFGLLSNRLNGRLDYYLKNGTNLFGDHYLDPTSGFSTIRANVASMRGKGFDFELNYSQGEQVRWNTKLLFSHAQDVVTNIAVNSSSNMMQGTQRFMSADRVIYPMIDRPVFAIYSYSWAGLDQQGNPQLFDEEGKIGNYMSILNSLSPASLNYHGPAHPAYFGGWSHGIEWRNFSLYATLTYKFGHYFRRSSIFYYGLSSTSPTFRSTGHSDYSKRWQNPGDELHTDVPAYPGYQYFDTYRDEAYRYANILVEKADHIRLKDIYLSYGLPTQLVKSRLNMQSVQFFAYLENVGLIWTSNKHGIDPDYVPQGNSNYLPVPRTVTFGLNLAF